MAAKTESTGSTTTTSNAGNGEHHDVKTDSSAKPLRRACDCCRKRKVRCDGQEPCVPCKKASIRCAYLQPPKKKGPKGLRSARVLHALRRIDDSASASPTSPLSPESGTFGNWNWTPSPTSRNGAPTTFPGFMGVAQPPPLAYAPTSSVAPDQQPFYQHAPTAMASLPPQATPLQPSLMREDSYRQQPAWVPGQAESVTTASEGAPPVLSPTSTESYHPQRQLSGEKFLPFVRLFFNHMFPIMPIIDQTIFLDPSLYANVGHMSPDLYCFLCALCAATIVQLDASIQQPDPVHGSKNSDDYFAEECLRERKSFDYIEATSPLSVMTSFFLFAYNGNHERHAKAWHYLQESITFAENLNMDDEDSYAKLEPAESQWRRRLYWLLFITERAYAVQRRKNTRLYANVSLPAVFESEDPQLLNGFVNLAKLFSAVDESFVSAWRGSRRASLCDEAWLAKMQRQLDATAQGDGFGDLTETQRLDISVTREWLHVLAWQMGVSNGLIWGQGEGGMRLDYPVELARKVVEITSSASALALDSHGIGMEQKLSDIAGCLADVLKCTAGDSSATFLEGKQYLNILLQKLSSMRGKESRYLKPLMSKMEGLMGYELGNTTLPLPDDPTQGFLNTNLLQVPSIQPPSPRWSMADSVGMLRSLSMSGNLGMPALAVPMEDWTQRRPSGRVLEMDEMESLQPWLNGTTAQSM